MTRTFRGHDELTGMMNSLLWFALSMMVVFGAAMDGDPRWLSMWAVSSLVTPIIWFGARYRLVVGDEGIRLTKYWLWPIARTRHFYLDCSAGLYEAWESDRPEGVFIDTGLLFEDSDVFGPYFDVAAMVVLAGEVNAAITASRGRVEGARHLQVEGLDADDFEVLERAPGGPPKQVRNRVRVRFRGLEIPAGSTLDLRSNGWSDPARPDEVTGIVLSGPTTLPNGVEAPVGAELSFWSSTPERWRVRGLPTHRAGDIDVKGGDTWTAFEGEQLVELTLAGPLQRGGYTLPAKSEVRRGLLLTEPTWEVRLGGDATVAGIALRRDERVTFDERWRAKYVSLNRREVVVDGVTLSGSLSALLIGRDGKLDIRACRRDGLVKDATELLGV